jgi:SWI/SNF-related matrix-associated actin-dependent regulator of chromatin subfamily A member 5
MPRKAAAKKEEPSSDEVSAHSDVEMQDQQDDTMNGFKKFGVRGPPVRAFLVAALSRRGGGRRDQVKDMG